MGNPYAFCRPGFLGHYNSPTPGPQSHALTNDPVYLVRAHFQSRRLRRYARAVIRSKIQSYLPWP